MRTAALFVAACGLLYAGQAKAQDRPSEADIFGAPPAAVPDGGGADGGAPNGDGGGADAEPAGAPGRQLLPAGSPPSPESRAPNEPLTRDDLVLGVPEDTTRLTAEAAPEDPLRIGGMIYLRAQSSIPDGSDLDDWTLSSPNLVDVYLDARPNERVRGFLLGRMFFDPTGIADGAVLPNGSGANAAENATALGLSGFATQRGPRVFLDQLWLRFDVKHRVFVTAGKQHFRWGTGRLWAPTDYLHLQPRNPLSPFDARLGTTMLKLHLPWEKRSWNLYGVALIEQPDAATTTLGSAMAGGRLEMVFGPSELAVDFLAQQDHKPKFGVDGSVGVWDFDLYVDLALRHSDDFLVWIDDVDCGTDACVRRPEGPLSSWRSLIPQATLGVSWSRKYNDNDVLTVGAEYFYNAAGYADADLYGLAFNVRQTFPAGSPSLPGFTPFYTGRHYAGLFVNLPAPGSWNYTTFNLAVLANLSDKSGVARLDYSLLMLTHLRFEAFAQVNAGTEGGEFNFALSPQPARQITPIYGDQPVVLAAFPFSTPTTIATFGVALRVSI